MARQMTI